MVCLKIQVKRALFSFVVNIMSNAILAMKEKIKFGEDLIWRSKKKIKIGEDLIWRFQT